MTEEKIVICADPAYPLNGMLTLPDDLSEKVPAVVFVHGSVLHHAASHLSGMTSDLMSTR